LSFLQINLTTKFDCGGITQDSLSQGLSLKGRRMKADGGRGLYLKEEVQSLDLLSSAFMSEALVT
jgi:hypothetical protein